MFQDVSRCFKHIQACCSFVGGYTWPNRGQKGPSTYTPPTYRCSATNRNAWKYWKPVKNIGNIYAHQDTGSKPQPGKAWRAALVPSSRLAVPGGNEQMVWSERSSAHILPELKLQNARAIKGDTLQCVWHKQKIYKLVGPKSIQI